MEEGSFPGLERKFKSSQPDKKPNYIYKYIES